MKKNLLALSIGMVAATAAFAEKSFDMNQAEPFEAKVLVEGLKDPWDMQIDRNGQLWITQVGGDIAMIDAKSGERKVIHHFDNVVNGGIQQGLLGLALDKNFLSGKGDNILYAAYAYKAADSNAYTKIVKLTLNEKADKVEKEEIVLDKLASYTDHQGGRLLLGPDNKLYYTIGNQGANQYDRTCMADRAQRLPTAEELANKDWAAYQGKTLRFNTDGSVPEDNPVLNGVKSHIYTYGHRNPQGIVFAGDKLFQEEQGPGSDDEVNLLEAGANYGWPHVAGYPDNQNYIYTSYATAEKCGELPQTIGDTTFETHGGEAPNKMVAQKETDFVQEANYRNPLKTFFTVRNGHNMFDKGNCPDSSYLCWPTAALSSIAYYPKDGKVKAWQNSILVSGLKSGAIYRMPLNSSVDDVQGELYKHFASPNRYRNVTVNHDGSKIYVMTDTQGASLGLDGKQNMQMQNSGAILVFEAK
ncbi:glucose/sorbosone family PQQ-dependent dehydrogenase [Mannheimia sp. HC-2023]|uniref:glucose/sorbosone family PQQ-dependent dehydrogenase n=1 Tax=Mannheimia indoligenes TaxID=3103145 RepID=UPI002FE6067E